MTSDALYRAAIMKSIENNPQYVTSPEFKQAVLNTTSIADYMRQGRVATHSSYSINKAKEQEEKHGGAAIEDIHSAQMDIKDTLTQIHKAMGYKRRKMSGKPEQPSSGVSNDFTENITNILKTLEELSIFKKVLDRITTSNVDMGTEDSDQQGTFRKALQFNQMLEHPLGDAEIASLAILPRDKTGNTIIEDLIEQFSELKDTGIPIEEFQNEISDIMSYTPNEVHPVLNLILNDVTQSEDKSDEYPGYDSEILKQYLTTPEQTEAFDRYYQWYINNMQDRMEKAKEAAEYAKAGYEEYKGMLPELRRNYAEFLNRWKTKNAKKQVDHANSLRVNDDDVLKQHGLSPDDMDDYVASKVPKKESYVMSYMTEQVFKDKFTPKGEFKDRGFKKLNYLEWLERNS
jgi:flagellar biosynthesis chaperone FliJ